MPKDCFISYHPLVRKSGSEGQPNKDHNLSRDHAIFTDRFIFRYILEHFFMRIKVEV